MLAIKHNIPEIKSKLKRILAFVDGGWQAEADRLMELGRARVANLTPESKERPFSQAEGAQHLSAGWTKHVIGGSGKSRVPLLIVVYNRFTHDRAGRPKKRALLRTVDGGRKSYTVLEVLEYGSPPHKIYPAARFRKTRRGGRVRYEARGGGVLRFVTKKGEVVFTKGPVDHPGTRPYAMVRTTRVFLGRLLAKQARRWAVKVGREWAR